MDRSKYTEKCLEILLKKNNLLFLRMTVPNHWNHKYNALLEN